MIIQPTNWAQLQHYKDRSPIWIKLHRALVAGGYRAKLTLQVHDELVLDVPREEVDDVRQLVNREMEQAVPLTVPLKADVETGDNWDSVK